MRTFRLLVHSRQMHNLETLLFLILVIQYIFISREFLLISFMLLQVRWQVGFLLEIKVEIVLLQFFMDLGVDRVATWIL